MTSAEHHHRLDYLEFATTDIEGSKRFFRQVFGWKFTDYGPGYTSFEDGRLTGGFHSKGQPGASPLAVIFSIDLSATKAAVLAAGGQVTNEHEFPGGRRFHCVEPGGNEIAIWTDR
ncbi:MAG: VOC family protein [Gemmatimonadales bacterium]